MDWPERQRSVFLLGPEQLEIRDVPLAGPDRGEILLRVGATTTCGTDVKVFLRGGHPRMLRTPTPFGHEVAGTIAAVGPGVTEWRSGERVVVVNSASCGRCRYCLQGRENLCRDLVYLNGAFAEYLLVPPRFVKRSTYRIPAAVSDDTAAITEPLACVLHGVDICSLTRPTDVLVLGAGPIGLLFVGILAADGHRVEVADPHRARLAVALQLGAAKTQVLRRRARDLAEPPSSSGPAGEYELTVDASGSVAGWQQAVALARPGGRVLFFGGCAPGSRMELDTARVHYDELTLLSAYHHRPATVERALHSLATRRFPSDLLLTAHMPLVDVEEALRSMLRRENLKVVLEP